MKLLGLMMHHLSLHLSRPPSQTLQPSKEPQLLGTRAHTSHHGCKTHRRQRLPWVMWQRSRGPQGVKAAMEQPTEARR